MKSTIVAVVILVSIFACVRAVPDCNGDEGGSARLNACGVCCKGNTGQACIGAGSGYDCGHVCFGNGTGTECDKCAYPEGEGCACGNSGFANDCIANCGGPTTTCFIICTAVFEVCNGICENADQTKDCAGVCGGTAAEDCLGVCNGTAVEDCAGVCQGTAVEDCAGVCQGTAVEDCLGVCQGTAVEDCAGVCNGTAVRDCLGVCEGTTPDEECEDFCRSQYHGLKKGIYGLCTAYCVAMHCPEDPQASENGCARVGANLAERLENEFALPAGSVDPDDACVDTDGDGVPDFRDAFPSDPESDGNRATNPAEGDTTKNEVSGAGTLRMFGFP